MTETLLPLRCDVAIIGGGPSGLAAATELKNLGIANVVVLEREPNAGGIPRHCGHPPFGMREFKRILTGPSYAKRLVARAKKAAVTICLNTTVVAINEGGRLELSTPDGLHELHATRVIICTGIRETPRAARLVSGQRPLGILTTGALQSTVYLQDKAPVSKPVIIGTELVSFSALLTCRHAKIKPVAMLEENSRITSRLGSQLLSTAHGVPIHLNTRLLEIVGKHQVEGVKISNAQGEQTTLKCDGVIFTGQFVAESSLMRASHLQIDPQTGNPIIDQFGRCSDPNFFATGNITHPVETAGYCWQDGVNTAHQVYTSLAGLLDNHHKLLHVSIGNPNIKYISPQHISLPEHITESQNPIVIQMRFNNKTKGILSLYSGEQKIKSKLIRALPEHHIEISISKPEIIDFNLPLIIDFKEY